MCDGKRTTDLESINRSLKREIGERKKLEEALQKQTDYLREKVKELKCLFKVSRLVADPDVPAEKVFRDTVDILQDAWQVPETTRTRLTIYGRQYAVPRWEASETMIGSDIQVGKKTVGRLEISYTAYRGSSLEKHILMDEKELLITVALLLSDFVQREHNIQQLRKSEKRYKTLVENLPQRVFHKDTNSVYISCNENYAEEHGVSRQEIEGKNDYDFYPEELAAKYQAEDKEVIATGEIAHIEEEFHMKGERRVVQTIKTPVKNCDGKVTGILGIHWDITDRKKTEEELHEYKEHLEEMVHERTAELEQFVFVASHDLQEPLRKIQAFGDRLVHRTESKLDQKGTFYIERMMCNASNMRQLLDDLLLYSRVIKKMSTFKEIDMNAMVADIILELGMEDNQKKRTFSIQELPFMWGDQWRIRELVLNLVTNALKFVHPDRAPKIVIEGKCVEDKWVDFSVKDNGIGFEQRYVGRIFKPFQRLHTRTEYEGTGMGLCIGKKIVEQHGGTILVKSTPGSGSTFTVRLPAFKKGTGWQL